MRLWGVSMVRNEEDIVEAFVRHNLTVLDGLMVVDHLSSDRTVEILRALCNERLPVVVVRSDSPGRLHSEVATTAARQVYERAHADMVFPLDADEFLHVPSRARLEQSLARIPPAHVGRIAWPTYAPSFDERQRDILEILRGARRLAIEAAVPEAFARKAVLPRHSFGANPGAYVAMGGHGAAIGRESATARDMPTTDLAQETVRLCHVPVRTRAQYVTKTAVLNLALQAANRGYRAGSSRRREFERLLSGESLTPAAMLATYLANTGPADTGGLDSLATIADPFLAPITLRYTPAAAPDPLPRVLSAIEDMTRRLRVRKAATHDGRAR